MSEAPASCSSDARPGASRRTPGHARHAARRGAVGALVAGSLAATVLAGSPTANAVTTVTTEDGAAFVIHDARRPSLDTGSIRSLSASRLEGFGNIFVQVAGDDAPLMNGEMLRGFGLTARGPETFVSTRSVPLGDIEVTRKVTVDRADETVAFLDTFTNTSAEPVEVEASFGGNLGYGTGNNSSTVRDTSDGDADVEAGDAWITTSPAATNQRPIGVVVGEQGPFEGATTAVGDQQLGPFDVPYSAQGSAANRPGFVHDLAIEPGETESLLRYVVAGAAGEGSLAPLNEATRALASDPDVGSLTSDELCTVVNWDLTSVAGFEAATCDGAAPLVLPEAPTAPASTTVAEYDPVGKTIDDLLTDLGSGEVTSVELTQAYLDRIAAFDDGQRGFKAFISVAGTALEQARAADVARSSGEEGALLGVPIAVKDIFDTADQRTTGGSRALEDWKPRQDAFQVASLREAGAVIIGKTNLSEWANSGSFSESGFKQTWNALYPSKTSFGSSGGSAVAVATDMAAGAMGTQTGVSLYAPATGAGLATFRGTDGLTSTAGVMPLTWAQDFAGPMAKTVTDLAHMLDATATRETGDNPDDILTSRVDDELRPEAWGPALQGDALEGKQVGFLPASFASSSFPDDTTGADVRAQLAALEAAGATIVEMPQPPSAGQSPSGNRGIEGWARYIELQEGFPYATGNEVLASPQVLPYNQRDNNGTPRMTPEQVDAWLAYRDNYKDLVAGWMEENGVDAVVYPGFISDMGNNDASSAALSSDRATGVLTSGAGLPTVVVPTGPSSTGYVTSMQIVGPAWSDTEVLGMGYALEQEVDTVPRTEFAPSLTYAPDPVASTTDVDVTQDELVYGGATSATITVAAPGTSPVGEVSVRVAGRTLTAPLEAGTATVELPTGLEPGRYQVEAGYAGDGEVEPSTGTATLTITRAVPTLRASLPQAQVGPGARARLVVRATNPGAIDALPPTGTVLVRERGRVLASARLTVVKDGRLALRLPRLDVGRHPLVVRLPASARYEPATAPRVVLRVRR